LAVGVAGLIIAIIVLIIGWHGKPVAAAFTRVGGLTRVETAVHASHLWTTPPQYYVTTPADADQQAMLCAARNAMANDAPLLFISPNGKIPPLVTTTIDNWKFHAKGSPLTRINVGEQPSGAKGYPHTRGDLGEEPSCPVYESPAAAKRLAAINRRNRSLPPYLAGERQIVGGVSETSARLSTLTASSQLLPSFLGVARRDTLAPLVIFAVARSFPVTSASAYPPDVAVGLALASHLAAQTPTASPKVSLVVVPRGYLEAEPQLEQQLRDQGGLVQGGVVLGSTRILPDGTQALLRQILTSTDRQTLLGQVQAALGSVEPVVAALLALAGLIVAVRAARKVIPEAIQAIQKANPERKWPSRIEKYMTTPADRTLKEQRTRTLNERFATAGEQLGNDKPTIRLAGVYAMAVLADDWTENRQTCVDMLCAYLRMPYEPDPGDGAIPEEQRAFQASREVRQTVIQVITAHLKDGAAVSWQGLNFDFTGVAFDGGDFSGAVFSGGTVNFTGAVFSGGTVKFNGARFSGGRVNFIGTEFSGGTVNFNGARFSGGTVNFTGAVFSGGRVYFNYAVFSGGKVDFSDASDWSVPPEFPWTDTPPAGVKLPKGKDPFSGVDPRDASPAMIDWWQTGRGNGAKRSGNWLSCGTGWPRPRTRSS
jgi:hypothetical protein